MPTIFNIYSEKEIEEKIKLICNLIEKKLKDVEILNKLDFEFKEKLLSIARARIKNEREHEKFIDAKYFNEADLRFSTPKIIADYRANKLKCNKIADLCSGIGMQASAFTKTSKEVFAIEIDERKVEYSKHNFKNENLKFIKGDILSEGIINKVKEFKPEIIFCDPERLAEEKERNVDSIKPNLKKLIEIYSKITANLAIELPPQIEMKKLKEFEKFGDFEAEYLSLNNKLNRLTLYFNSLGKSEVSVVDVLSGARLEKDKLSKLKKVEKTNYLLNYIFEPTTAIEKAHLGGEFAEATNSKILENSEKGKLLFTSNSPINKEIKNLCKSYSVIKLTDFFKDTIRLLKKLNFGKVVLKYSISPENYWRERNKLEGELKGEREATLFAIIEKGNRKFVLCERV